MTKHAIYKVSYLSPYYECQRRHSRCPCSHKTLYLKAHFNPCWDQAIRPSGVPAALIRKMLERMVGRAHVKSPDGVVLLYGMGLIHLNPLTRLMTRQKDEIPIDLGGTLIDQPHTAYRSGS